MTPAAGNGRPARIAIIGSANVGKSTLFNRLVGRRQAITERTPGVTRDPIEADLTVGDRRCLLVDTGGFSCKPSDPLDKAVTRATLAAAEAAEVVLLVLDVERLDEDDRELIERARRWAGRVLLVVNKVDTELRDADASNLRSLGFPRVVAVSAEHGRNTDGLLEAIGELLPEVGDEAGGAEPEDTTIRVCIMGKPNTGKSTLLNRLLGSARAIVSDIPGTTRDVIEGRFEYRGRDIVILDTAGVRRKSRVTNPLEYYSVHRAISSIKDSEIVLLVVDAVEGLADQDKKIASIVVREGRGLVFVLNKWDLFKGDERLERASRSHVQRLLPGLDFAPVIAISARTGRNVPRLLQTVVGLHEELHRRVGTGQLNHGLEEWTAEHPPSARYNVKIRYGTQVSTNPQRFVFFANKSWRLPSSYERYLAGRLRETFGLGRVPGALEIKQKGGVERADADVHDPRGVRAARRQTPRASLLGARHPAGGAAQGQIRPAVLQPRGPQCARAREVPDPGARAEHEQRGAPALARRGRRKRERTLRDRGDPRRVAEGQGADPQEQAEGGVGWIGR